MTSPRVTALLAIALLGFGCWNGAADNPVAPKTPEIPPPTGPSAAGLWTVVGAEPAGDCMADYVSGNISFFDDYEFDLVLERVAKQVRLQFRFRGFDAQEGFWPSASSPGSGGLPPPSARTRRGSSTAAGRSRRS